MSVDQLRLSGVPWPPLTISAMHMFSMPIGATGVILQHRPPSRVSHDCANKIDVIRKAGRTHAVKDAVAGRCGIRRQTVGMEIEAMFQPTVTLSRDPK